MDELTRLEAEVRRDMRLLRRLEAVAPRAAALERAKAAVRRAAEGREQALAARRWLPLLSVAAALAAICVIEPPAVDTFPVEPRAVAADDTFTRIDQLVEEVEAAGAQLAAVLDAEIRDEERTLELDREFDRLLDSLDTALSIGAG